MRKVRMLIEQRAPQYTKYVFAGVCKKLTALPRPESKQAGGDGE